jgi:hypothetical protein
MVWCRRKGSQVQPRRERVSQELCHSPSLGHLQDKKIAPEVIPCLHACWIHLQSFLKDQCPGPFPGHLNQMAVAGAWAGTVSEVPQ